MAEVVPFKPRAGVAASLNVRAFVKLCRTQCTVFGADLPFDSLEWDTIRYTQQPGVRRKTNLIGFWRIRASRWVTPVPMAEPFQSFAKAYIRYSQGLNPAVKS